MHAISLSIFYVSCVVSVFLSVSACLGQKNFGVCCWSEAERMRSGNDSPYFRILFG